MRDLDTAEPALVAGGRSKNVGGGPGNSGPPGGGKAEAPPRAAL
jgi:hypothetical protein